VGLSQPDARSYSVSNGPAATALAILAVLSCSTCDRPATNSLAEPVYFSESDSAYVIGKVNARLGDFGDDRVAFGSILDVEKIPSGWAVLDGLNNHIVLVDGDLNSPRIVGGPGEGPGEFQAPGQLAMVGDTIAVLEMGSGGRISYLAPQGGFLRRSGHVGHPVRSIGIHPELGRFFPILSRDYYLVRATEEAQWPIAPVPAAFVPEIKGSADAAGMTPNLVAVTGDGTTHVFDGEHLALVSYDASDDTSGRIAFLPREMRDRKLKETAEAATVFGGSEVRLSQWVTMLDPLDDGRIFMRAAHGTSQGYVLDPGSLTATPIVVASDHWSQVVVYFDGRHLILGGGLTPELVLATTELVPRPSTGGEGR